MDACRTFIAIELPEQALHTLAQAQSTLRTGNAVAARSVKWVQPTAIHLTLKFLGETPLTQIEALAAAISAAAGLPRFELALDAPAASPALASPACSGWACPETWRRWPDCSRRWRATLRRWAFRAETRPFSAHLTLGRVRDDASPDVRRTLGQAVQALRLPPVAFTVEQVSLIRSELRPEGPVYTSLARAALSGVD